MNNRIKLLLMVGVLVLPTVLAYLAYEKFNWRPASQKNYGDLLAPTPLRSSAGTWKDGSVSTFERTKGKWVLVYVGPSDCDESCKKNLYYMRQVRILQDTERHRIKMVWVLTDTGNADETLLQSFADLDLWRPADPLFVNQFPKKEANSRHIYLADPKGNLILRFPDQPDAMRMTKDIKLLLKASQIG